MIRISVDVHGPIDEIQAVVCLLMLGNEATKINDTKQFSNAKDI